MNWLKKLILKIFPQNFIRNGVFIQKFRTSLMMNNQRIETLNEIISKNINVEFQILHAYML